MEITFHGAARTVTGSKHLIKTDNGTKILLECGMFQGMGAEADKLNRHFGFDPVEIDHLILSHAHIDHSGLIPRLVKHGFKGKIYCTSATFDLCRLMLSDSANIQEHDAAYINRRRRRQDRELLDVLYDMNDTVASFDHFVTVDYGKWFEIEDNIMLQFTDAGHVLGSAAVNLRIREGEELVRLCFTGDIGRRNDPILRSPEQFPQADHIICESTYGDRLHEPMEDSEERLLNIVRDTCVKNKGKLIIPAFSLDRTQELVFALDQMEHKGLLPPIKVFVDSPLSVQTTHIVEKHVECYNDEVHDYMTKGDQRPFYFKNLHYITKVEDSKAINELKEPCIIISASGMAEAGRIKHHIKNNISDPANTILMVGYCTPGSLGGRLRNRDERVRIFGEEYEVKARVEVMDSYSAHGDYEEMMEYLSCQNADEVKKLFLVHGDTDVMNSFREKLMANGFRNVYIPEMHEKVKL
jgi:metallo-beta-lactamase family protein